MEPIFRPFCSRFRRLPRFVARSLRNFKASVRFIGLTPQIAGFGSQRMCPSCGLITSRSKTFCLECGKPLPAVYWGEKMHGNKSVIVIWMVIALLILYAIVVLIRRTVFAPVLGNGDGTHQASSHWIRRQPFLGNCRTQHLTRLRKEEAEL